MSLDFYLFQLINSWAGQYSWLDNLGVFFAKYFGYLLIFFLLLFLIKNFKKYWPMVVKAFSAAILARLVIVNIIRFFYYRPRPFIANQVNLLLSDEPTGSFPSGHAAFYFAISTVIFLYLKKIYPSPRIWWGVGILFFGASFLISIARVFSGIHWPSDILTGALIGIFSGWLITKVFRK